MKRSDSITCIKGIGEKSAALFQKLGIFTVGDLLEYYPRDYEIYEAAIPLEQAKKEVVTTFELTLVTELKWKKVRNLTIGSAVAADESGRVTLTFYNATYLKSVLKKGGVYLMRGILKVSGSAYKLEHPRIFSFEEYKLLTSTLQPCYPLTRGLTNKAVQKAAKNAFAAIDEPEYLPEELLQEYELEDREWALRHIHFPENYEQMIRARQRLVFDEFFAFLLGLRLLKEKNEREKTVYPMLETADAGRLIEALPYALTGAQRRVWEELKEDLCSGFSMNRVIQGDVGSGKTILAFLALLMTVANGYQGALMAPTEILAGQHYEQLLQLTKAYKLPFTPVLLTGSLSAAAKREAYEKIASGKANVVIGTHALIQEKVHYARLALVITDEQHRFGVKQRESFSEKGEGTHVLVMSATPIPRTLAIILYGDMHLSLVDERPAHRLPIKNCVVNTDYRKKAYEFMVREVSAGHQVYVICPMVDENDSLANVENVVEYTEKLKAALPASIRVEYLHGKMKSGDKSRIYENFAAGHIDVLVSTTVIEVGINVPNATLMVVENAERFGLAQLHQLRGRIGRGSAQSYCIFISGSDNESSMERLKILNRSNDGFYIAEEDLKLRGPGDLFGIRQSGVMEFKIADIYQDSSLLKKISRTVDEILKEDAGFQSLKYQKMWNYLQQKQTNLIDFRSI